MNKLETIIDSMLKENTGTHFLDSGGTGGRAWQRNQDHVFEKEEPYSLHIRADEDGELTEFWVTFNLYHFMKAHLDIDEVTEKWQKKFDKFANLPEWEREAWEDVMEAFCKKYKVEVKESYYTYNFDTILSQDIVVHEINPPPGEDDLIFLRVHGGCDARGGFTAPRIFRKSEYFDSAMNHADAFCTGRAEEIKAGVNRLVNLPEEYCERSWTFDGEWYPSCSYTPEFFNGVRYDEESGKILCRSCGHEVVFGVMESY